MSTKFRSTLLLRFQEQREQLLRALKVPVVSGLALGIIWLAYALVPPVQEILNAMREILNQHLAKPVES